MAIEQPSDARAPFATHPERLWSTPLRSEERFAVRRAFEQDGELRPEAENLLRGCGAELCSAFVLVFARRLAAAPARPAAALMPALEETVGVAIGRPKRDTPPTLGKSDK
jgi:hypothetical protein